MIGLGSDKKYWSGHPPTFPGLGQNLNFSRLPFELPSRCKIHSRLRQKINLWSRCEADQGQDKRWEVDLRSLWQLDSRWEVDLEEEGGLKVSASHYLGLGWGLQIHHAAFPTTSPPSHLQALTDFPVSSLESAPISKMPFSLANLSYPALHYQHHPRSSTEYSLSFLSYLFLSLSLLSILYSNTSWLSNSTYLYFSFVVFPDKAKRTQQGNLLLQNLLSSLSCLS